MTDTMPKKKEKKYMKWKKGEMEFIPSDFISFFLDDPEVFDINLAKMEDPVTHPDTKSFWEKRAEGYLYRPGSQVTPFVILMWFIEESARKILKKFGHTTDLQELYDYKQMHTRPVTDKHGFTSMVCDLEPECIAAIRVLRLASHLRDYLEVNNADKAALTTMRIMFAAFNMEAGETLMRGIKALAAPNIVVRPLRSRISADTISQLEKLSGLKG